jgi:hypothetical protein
VARVEQMCCASMSSVIDARTRFLVRDHGQWTLSEHGYRNLGGRIKQTASLVRVSSGELGLRLE